MPATTLEKPVSLECACPSCHCTVTGESPYRLGDQRFCCEACAQGHPGGVPCHAGCGCEGTS